MVMRRHSISCPSLSVVIKRRSQKSCGGNGGRYRKDLQGLNRWVWAIWAGGVAEAAAVILFLSFDSVGWCTSSAWREDEAVQVQTARWRFHHWPTTISRLSIITNGPVSCQQFIAYCASTISVESFATTSTSRAQHFLKSSHQSEVRQSNKISVDTIGWWWWWCWVLPSPGARFSFVAHTDTGQNGPTVRSSSTTYSPYSSSSRHCDVTVRAPQLPDETPRRAAPIFFPVGSLSNTIYPGD